MREKGLKSKCPLCGGQKKPGRTIYSVDLVFGIVVVRNVPATLCDQCGEEWISSEVASQLERLVEEARRKKLQVEVVAL